MTAVSVVEPLPAHHSKILIEFAQITEVVLGSQSGGEVAPLRHCTLLVLERMERVGRLYCCSREAYRVLSI